MDPQSIDWFTTASERGAAPLPPGVRVTQLEGTSIVQLFEQRRVDAALLPRALTRELMEAGATSLLADAPATQSEYFARTGIFPIMYFIAMRRSLASAQPQLVAALCAAFETSVRPCLDVDADLPGPVGLVANRPTLERFFVYAREQGLVRDLPALADLFVPEACNQQALA